MRHSVRLAPAMLAALVLAGCAATPHPRPGHGPHDRGPGHGPGGEPEREPGHGRVFISPMGEPFRGSESQHDPEREWFDGADIYHDGKLSSAEFAADARRFFAVLDRHHDGEIDPDDIDYYESTMAPEVRSGQGGGFQPAPSDDGGSAKAPAYDAGQLGASRFSYFDLPEPVAAADRNLNRGIDPAEFAYAADHRFASLDRNKDGFLTFAELPHPSGRVSRSSGGHGGGPGGHGGRGGGHHGGGMSGMGGGG